MKARFLPMLAGSVVLLSTLITPAGAQKHFYPAQLIVPECSLERPEDLGIAAHTNYQVLLTTSTPGLGAKPMGGLGPGGGMTPAQVLSFYKIKTVKGSKIVGVVDAYDCSTALADFNAFSAQFGLPQETSTKVTASTNKVFQVVYQGGVQPANGYYYGWDVEEDLDMQWAHAMAPSAKIILFEAQSSSYSDLLATEQLAGKTVGLVGGEVSNSWGGGEFTSETGYDSSFVAKNVVFLASTGDSGAFYGASYPAVSPNVVAAGGTTEITDSTGKLIAHWGWEDGGGGPSGVETQPSYQAGVLNTDPTYRSTPDVSAIADSNTGVSVYIGDYGGWYVVGGTSVSSPVLAGLINSAGHFYADSPTELAHIYASEKKYFTDVLTGWNGYFCTKTYDFVTGVGVPNGLLGL